MKFWNKHPEVRRRCWTCVAIPAEPDAPHFGGLVGWPYHGWPSRGPFTDLFTKLQRQNSKGKFYMTIIKKEVWFENSADASWFILTHMGD